MTTEKNKLKEKNNKTRLKFEEYKKAKDYVNPHYISILIEELEGFDYNKGSTPSKDVLDMFELVEELFDFREECADR